MGCEGSFFKQQPVWLEPTGHLIRVSASLYIGALGCSDECANSPLPSGHAHMANFGNILYYFLGSFFLSLLTYFVCGDLEKLKEVPSLGL